jgi:hypothetical protein
VARNVLVLTPIVSVTLYPQRGAPHEGGTGAAWNDDSLKEVVERIHELWPGRSFEIRAAWG